MRSLRPVVLFLTLAVVAGCSRKQSANPQIISFALTPAENLSGDESLNWIGDAIPALLSMQLEGLPTVSARRVPNARDAVGGNIVRVHCRYSKGAAGNLAIDCWKDGADTEIHSSGQISQSLADAIAPIAKSLDINARPARQVSNDALKAYAHQNYEEAVRIDPDFGLAYADGSVVAAGKGERDRAIKLVQAGLARGNAIEELQKARLEFTKATLTGDRNGQINALAWLTRLDKTDSERLRNYAQFLLAARKLPEAAAAQGLLAELLPDDPGMWNMLGYYRAYAGNLDGARQALEHYLKISPDSANALDSLGEVHFYLGKFAEAEKYFLQSFEKQPQFNRGDAAYKAAIARFRTGDVAGAKQLFEKYVSGKPDRAWLEIRWEYLTGNREKAETAAKAYAAKEQGSAVGLTHLAAWALARGEFVVAKAGITEAMRVAKSPEERGDVAALFLILRKVDGINSEVDPRLKAMNDLAETWAFLFKKDNAAAEPRLKQLYEQTSVQNDRQPRILLAWAKAGLNKKPEAQALLQVNTIPPSSGGALETILFVKESELRR